MPQAIDYIAQFHAFLLTEKRVSQNTFLSYRNDLAQFEQFLKKSKVTLKKITKVNLSAFLKHCKKQGVSARTLSRRISSLKLFFNFLHERFGFTNYGKTLVFPKVEKTLPHYLTEQEIERLLNAANKDSSPKGIRNKVMLYLLYATGMRVSELVNITVDQLHFDTGFIHLIGKGKKERMVPLPKNILELLTYYLENVHIKLLPKNMMALQRSSTYLFPTRTVGTKTKPMSRQTFWLILKKFLSQAGIFKDISPHSLRHSLATHLLKSGVDIRSLQMILGHESLATVQTYTHLGNNEVRKIYNKKHPRA
ncbi:MAG: tyrosine recombinase [Epsilonproteobacteria bacterium]|nr:tyrosine recombinase [Campylobacterota bacterium]